MNIKLLTISRKYANQYNMRFDYLMTFNYWKNFCNSLINIKKTWYFEFDSLLSNELQVYFNKKGTKYDVTIWNTIDSKKNNAHWENFKISFKKNFMSACGLLISIFIYPNQSDDSYLSTQK